jgi:hypothetical protein
VLHNSHILVKFLIRVRFRTGIGPALN